MTNQVSIGGVRAAWLAAALLLCALSGACIDVGHRAEVGCLVDPTEPGCTPDAAISGRKQRLREEDARGVTAESVESAEAVEEDDDEEEDDEDEDDAAAGGSCDSVRDAGTAFDAAN